MRSKLIWLGFVLSGVYACDPSESMERGRYNVTSDCSDAESKSGTVDLSGIGDSYKVEGAMAFGFPSERFIIRGPHKITVEGDSRFCKTVVFKNSDDFMFFACFDDGSESVQCSIYMQRN